MSTDSNLEYVVKTIAETAVANEKEFGDLDAVVGDGADRPRSCGRPPL